MKQQLSGGTAEISIGFAADSSGSGIAYAATRYKGRDSLLRVPFFVPRAAASQGREVGYGALRAVADAVRERHAGEVHFFLSDGSLVADLEERRALPMSLTIPYVALRCSLNRFPGVLVTDVRTSQIGDLTARALAEVSLHVAA